MRHRAWISTLSACLACAAVSRAASTVSPTPLAPASVTASSSRPGHPPAKVADGDPSDRSRWLSSATATGPHWLQLDFKTPQTLAGLHLFSGYEGANPLTNFTVQFWRDAAWVDVPSAIVTGNKAAAVALAFDETVTVTTNKLRIWITDTPDAIARVAEVVVWPASAAGVPPLPASAAPAESRLIFLNQSGFDSGSPKRFTAPTLADGTLFEVRPASGGPALFSGRLRGQVGHFTVFEPGDTREYVIAAGPLLSVPFRVGPWWLERVTYQGAVDFMIDSRHHVGNDRRLCRGSFGWRDDHHFGWELNTLVPQWISNPSAYARMARQITYEAPTDSTLWGKLQPPAADAPDLVKLIHWGADIIVTQGLTHELMKSQLAYFLYAWPVLKDHLPAQNYEVVRDFTFATWAAPAADRKYPYDESPEHDLLALKTKLGSTKGGYPPGFSIEPNLLLHEVAKREGRPDSSRYLDAAVRQAAWMVAKLDWNDPLTTKGQRMSEFVTVTGLAHLLATYPASAPAGLAQKLNDWAAVVIRRSDNLWDFRKLGDAPDQWTPMGEKPTMWNEPGNVVGLPAAISAALPFVTDSAARDRLDQIVWSHFDGMFGRNPTGRHFSYDAPREIEGVEHGWYNFHVGGIGRLEQARFVLDGSPKNQHYPFRPEVGNIGWTEGWIQHNTPFNLSLAYLAHARSKLELRRSGDELLVRLTAPLDFNYAQVETGAVIITSESGDREVVTVTEESASSRTLLGRLPLAAANAAKPGDGKLSYRSGDTFRANYGFGYLGQETSLPANSDEASAAAESAALFDLGARVQPASPSARFELPGYYVWCGAPFKDESGKHHLFYARWPAATELPPGRAWALHSEIAYAVGDGPFGPFRHVSVILPARGLNPATGQKYWDADCTLNPNLLRHPDGKLYLFYMGNHGDLKDYATHRNHQRIGVAVADRPEGPWTRFDQPVIDVSPDPSAFDSLVVTNPAATLRPDGKVLLLYKAVTQLPGKVMGGRVRYGAALADHPTGPFVKTPGRIFLPPAGDDANTWMFAEDPFIWFSKTYGNRFYAVTRDVAGKFTGDLGAITLFESADGLDWRPAPRPLVLPSAYALADGTRSDIKLERPVVLLDGDEPVALYGGGGGYHQRSRLSANVQIPFAPAQ